MSRTKAPPHPAAIDPSQSIDWDAIPSRFDHMPKPPLRWILRGESGSGKSIVMQQLILNHYRGAHQRVFIFHPQSTLISALWIRLKSIWRTNSISISRRNLHSSTPSMPKRFVILSKHRRRSCSGKKIAIRAGTSRNDNYFQSSSSSMNSGMMKP